MDKKKIVTRIKTVKGHLNGIEKMIEEDKDCKDIMVQIAAIKSSVDRIGHLLIENYAEQCLLDAAMGDSKKLEDKVKDTLSVIMKFSK
ncbi:MAG: metal-sensitive transcriptional regulator [Halanaerobium sp.]|nr:metal-sensitive transcriptional regulator [Halanaerobium sp.]